MVEGGSRDHRRRPARRRDGDRGAVLVEFGLIMPVFFLLVFGMIEFGMALNNQTSMRHGVREAVRRAVVAEVGSDSSCPIYGGGSPGADTVKLICLTKEEIGLSKDETRVRVEFPNSTYTPGDPIVICAERPMESVTGMFSGLLDGKVIQTEVEMRVEFPLDNLDTFGEQLADGRDWSWCS